MNTREYQLPNEATVQWLLDSLGKGPSLSLAKLVAATHELSGFAFKTYAKSGLAESELVAFSEGGKAVGAEADEWLLDTLTTALKFSDFAVLVEDWRGPSREFLSEMHLPAMHFGDEVYFLVRSGDPRKIEHWRRIFSNTSPTFHAFLFKDVAHLTAGEELTHADLVTCSRHVRMIIAGAYDGESYVIGRETSNTT